MGKFQMPHLSGGGTKQSGIMMRKGSAFPKASALYQSETGQQEAQRKADTNNANANRVYGETTSTRTKVEGGTRVDYSTPYTTKGKGKAKRNSGPKASNADWQKFLDKNYGGSNENFNASQSGKGVENKTRFIPNSITELTPQKISMIPVKPTAEKIKFTPKNTTTTSEKIEQKPKPKKGVKIKKVVKNVGEGIGDFVENTGEGIGNVVRNVGEGIGDGVNYLFGRRGVVTSLFGCRTCKGGGGVNRRKR